VVRAEAAGKKFQKPLPFDGWWHVAAKELAEPRQGDKYPVIASPVKEPEPEDNDFHAHVVRPHTVDYYDMSLHLKHIFTTYGGIERHDPTLPPPPEPTWLQTVREWIAESLTQIATRLRGQPPD
jgi:hypothetical protein